MEPGTITLPDTLADAGSRALNALAHALGLGFAETAVLLIWVAWPSVLLVMAAVILRQRRRLARLEALLPDHWRDLERLAARTMR